MNKERTVEEQDELYTKIVNVEKSIKDSDVLTYKMNTGEWLYQKRLNSQVEKIHDNVLHNLDSIIDKLVLQVYGETKEGDYEMNQTKGKFMKYVLSNITKYLTSSLDYKEDKVMYTQTLDTQELVKDYFKL